MSEYQDWGTGEIVSTTYNRSPDLNELFAALAKAQGEFESAKRVAENPHFRSRYATLEAVLDATADGRRNNQLALIQMPGNGPGNTITVTTLLGHASGQWIESTFGVAPAKFDSQGAGSVVTHLRRYAAMSILGIAPEDDDGNAAAIIGRPVMPATVPLPTNIGATRSASPRAVPAANHGPSNNGRVPKWVAGFLMRDSYEIDPQQAGGWSAWEKAYLDVAHHADNYDQVIKLENDNNAHLTAFCSSVKLVVYEQFLSQVEGHKYRLASKLSSEA